MVMTKFEVGMTCEKCSDACTNILSAMPGVQDVKCCIEKKEVIVTGDANPTTMLQALQNWAKENDKGVVTLSSA
ncbi:unnamed protein product [Albugo candida]|uniref:HMA domain-containing protein n=1 Tax=Albugo candida TaxID=65357 RepID=A0A024GB80_9STRA|nr:unnamed protein product [Albugo candida]|eukprot:CCI44126.1 unnamed protein product [Albugo candida]